MLYEETRNTKEILEKNPLLILLHLLKYTVNSYTVIPNSYAVNLKNKCDDKLNLHLKNLTDQNVQDAGILILYMLNIVRNILVR